MTATAHAYQPSLEWRAITGIHRMSQSRSVMAYRLLAHRSSILNASLMAVDTSGNFEIDLQRLLDEET
jgi:hypothetical protein